MKFGKFEPKITVETAVYLGDPGGGKIGRALFSLMGSPRTVDKVGYHVRNFDWDGHVMVRPCDVHLGADKWDMRTGKHIHYINYSEESWATYYALLFMDGVLFGNGSAILYGDQYGKAVKLAGDCDVNSFVTTRDRNNVAWLSSGQKHLHCIQKQGYGSYRQRSMPLPDYFERGYFTRLYCNPHSRTDNSLFCFEGSPTPDQHAKPAVLARFDLDSWQFVKSSKLQGLQTIALSPDGHELTAVTAEYCVRLNAHNLEILDQIRVEQIRESELYIWPPIQYSPCGRYLAHSTSKSGEVEISDAKSLRRLSTLKTGGTPSSVFSWSCDGRFLASSVLPRSGGHAKLLVWDIDNFSLVADIGPLRHGGADMLYSNKPGFFAWHDNVNEFVVLKSNGDAVRYVQSPEA